jgi:hypothetical protein
VSERSHTRTTWRSSSRAASNTSSSRGRTQRWRRQRLGWKRPRPLTGRKVSDPLVDRRLREDIIEPQREAKYLRAILDHGLTSSSPTELRATSPAPFLPCVLCHRSALLAVGPWKAALPTPTVLPSWGWRIADGTSAS